MIKYTLAALFDACQPSQTASIDHCYRYQSLVSRYLIGIEEKGGNMNIDIYNLNVVSFIFITRLHATRHESFIENALSSLFLASTVYRAQRPRAPNH